MMEKGGPRGEVGDPRVLGRQQRLRSPPVGIGPR